MDAQSFGQNQWFFLSTCWTTPTYKFRDYLRLKFYARLVTRVHPHTLHKKFSVPLKQGNTITAISTTNSGQLAIHLFILETWRCSHNGGVINNLVKGILVILTTSFYDINQKILRKKGYFQNFSWFWLCLYLSMPLTLLWPIGVAQALERTGQRSFCENFTSLSFRDATRFAQKNLKMCNNSNKRTKTG